MKTPKKDDSKLVAETVRLLPVALTHEELLDRARQLAECEERLREEEDRAAQVKADHKNREAAILADRSRLAAVVRTRQEPRDVQCQVRENYVRNVRTVTRTDTGATVEERALTLEERQLELGKADDDLVLL